MYFNKKRADELMDQFNIDLLIASTPENVTYLSDTVSWAPKVYSYSVDMFATYFRDNNLNSSLIVPSQEMTYVSASNTWINDFYTYGGKSALIQESEQVIESAEEALDLSKNLNFPILVRPSYVLGGQGMKIVINSSELEHHVVNLLKGLPGNRILLDHYLDQAIHPSKLEIGHRISRVGNKSFDFLAGIFHAENKNLICAISIKL